MLAVAAGVIVTDETFSIAAKSQSRRPTQNAPGALVHPVRVARWPPLSKILDEGSDSNKQEIAISFSDFRIGLP